MLFIPSNATSTEKNHQKKQLKSEYRAVYYFVGKQCHTHTFDMANMVKQMPLENNWNENKTKLLPSLFAVFCHRFYVYHGFFL